VRGYASALEQLAETQPDIAFSISACPASVASKSPSLSELSPRTQVVFVTAYDQYAIDAFEQGAMDYLLKPVSDERLLAPASASCRGCHQRARTMPCSNACCSAWGRRRAAERPPWPGSPPATAARRS
jgi:DNA-binding LytR/AlgR family response regulator